MKSPWKAIAQLDHDGEYLVLASSLPARSLSSTGQLFRGASAVKKQLLTAEGLVGFSLLARPLRKQYATLSIWRDESTLQAFAHATPHGELMSELAPLMAEPRFVRWTISGRDGRPSWRDALRRLARSSSDA